MNLPLLKKRGMNSKGDFPLYRVSLEPAGPQLHSYNMQMIYKFDSLWDGLMVCLKQMVPIGQFLSDFDDLFFVVDAFLSCIYIKYQ